MFVTGIKYHYCAAYCCPRPKSVLFHLFPFFLQSIDHLYFLVTLRSF
nr:MAG TPA: hypothetical protein [Caudoviricetes sp.]